MNQGFLCWVGFDIIQQFLTKLSHPPIRSPIAEQLHFFLQTNDNTSPDNEFKTGTEVGICAIA